MKISLLVALALSLESVGSASLISTRPGKIEQQQQEFVSSALPLVVLGYLHEVASAYRQVHPTSIARLDSQAMSESASHQSESTVPDVGELGALLAELDELGFSIGSSQVDQMKSVMSEMHTASFLDKEISAPGEVLRIHQSIAENVEQPK
ncbi:hypothetical protein DL89DRAFT_264971 [Linderina pennispora]|uniref:Uncharacterized protein n=1 Tax=Linderina pennispora TaxID=61395 RepID=A0A1Y1WGW9_9FUNG|nr:uncharacterized protein DL89DRAFT_264971 [Linderina pennispora]ORX72773.1 hypothetical protein DL89DRAFT_264971 [Linderina pennispora]